MVDRTTTGGLDAVVTNSIDDIKLAVIGLGYVGLPLAVEFARQRPVVGFDTNH